MCTSSRASESCSVISANERVRPPSSSRDANTAFELKSPRATWRTPSASSSSGCASWLLSAIASSSAPNTASTSASVSVPMYILRRPVARQRALLVLAVGVAARRARWRPAPARSGCVTTRKRSCSPSAKLLLGIDGDRAHARGVGAAGRGVLVEPFELADDALRARLAQQRAAPAARASAPSSLLPVASSVWPALPTTAIVLAPRAARAGARATSGSAERGALAEALGGQPRLGREVG